jgi:hypothetical protein
VLELDVCSICLAVADEDGWIEAGATIRRLRTFELAHVASLRPGVCPARTDRIRTSRVCLLADIAAA